DRGADRRPPPHDPDLADGAGDPRGDPPADRWAWGGRGRRASITGRPPGPRSHAARYRGSGSDGHAYRDHPVHWCYGPLICRYTLVPVFLVLPACIHSLSRCTAGHCLSVRYRARRLAAEAPARRGPARPRPPRPPRTAAAIPGRIRSSTRPRCPGCPALARQTPESAMTVYADTPRWPRHGMLWGHLISDTSLEELHDAAASAGLPPRSFDLDHYDWPEQARGQLEAAGVQMVDNRRLTRILIGSG